MKKTSPAYIIIFIAVLSGLFGAGISAVHYGTLNMLEKNEKLHTNRTICNAFRLNVDGTDAEAYEKAIRNSIVADSFVQDDRQWKIYTLSDTTIGFTFTGMGFWDRITGILVLSPDLKTILNIQFFDHKETPGLGARIEESWFTEQFNGLKIAWDKPVEERVIIGTSPDPNATNRVDAITGASQTSLTLMKMLNSELEKFKKAWSAQDANAQR